jgi:hypothetical protein
MIFINKEYELLTSEKFETVYGVELISNVFDRPSSFDPRRRRLAAMRIIARLLIIPLIFREAINSRGYLRSLEVPSNSLNSATTYSDQEPIISRNGDSRTLTSICSGIAREICFQNDIGSPLESLPKRCQQSQRRFHERVEEVSLTIYWPKLHGDVMSVRVRTPSLPNAPRNPSRSN